ncbi:hypothetical protein, partial [Campylobacter sp. JMF_08 NE1]|uniref:hypothetical protein n=1 Tax=Campylobacter sp. JMF_08 NE1 TaxID=2983821 RepID=UPI0022E9D854
MKALNQSRGSIVLAAMLFAVGGVNIANADKIIGTNDASPYVGVDSAGNKLTTGASVTISGTSTDGFTFSPNRHAYGGYAKGVADSNISGNTINIENANIQGPNSSRNIMAGRAEGDGSEGSIAQENKLTIKDSNITIGSGTIYPSVIGGRVDRAGGEAKNNTVEISNSDVTYYIYGGKGDGNSADNNSTIYNNHVYIKDSTFGSVWGGQAQAPSDDKNHAKYNTLVIEGGGYSQKAKSGDLRAGTTYGAGDSEYNTLFISGGTTLDRNNVSIFGGYSQGKATGNNRYNQLILDNVKIPNASDTIYAGGIKTNTTTLSNTEAVGNRAYINDLDFANGIVVGGGSELGNTSDNIVVINGNTKLKSAYSGKVREGADGTAKDNLVIMSGGTISENIYGGYTQGGETSGNAVYFMGGEVSGIVGGGNNGNKNTLILGKDKDNLGVIKAGQISNFNTLQFNAVKDGTNTDAVLTLTDSANGADLNGVTINFLNESSSDGAVEVLVGGDNGVGVNKKRNSGGGANAITELTKNAIKYGANLDTIAVVVSGAEAKNDIIENLQRTLSDGSTKPQTSYGIGDTFNYKYKTIDLKQPNKKYYLIKSNAPLQNYNKIKLENPANPTWIGKELKENSGIKIADIYQPDQIYKILSSTEYKRNLRGMFVENGDKDLFITGIDEITESWNDNEFDTNEFSKFNQPSNTGNHVYIEANAGDLGGKTIYGGYSDSEDVNNNNIYINQGANLSNATIIGGYSISGKVSNNTVDLNNTSVIADITLAQTDSGSVKVSNDNIKNADGVTIGGSVTIAKSTGSANLNGLNFEMPKFEKITGDF